MKLTLIIILQLSIVCLFQANTFAQELDKTVTVTVSGSGKTLDEAKKLALRSAIEQAFGAFISSKTEIMNDQVLADQMTSVSSGNIQSFTVLNEAQLPEGSWGITLKVIVSINKLISFSEAKGISVKINGGLFATNVRQQILNEQGEFKAICELVGLLHEPMQTAFDYTIKSGDPKSLDRDSKNWMIPIVVTSISNKNIDFCADYFIKTISSISLSQDEVNDYQKLDKSVYPILIIYKNQSITFHLRNHKSMRALNTFVSQWEFYARLFKFKISDWSYFRGNGNFHKFDINSYSNYQDSYKDNINKFELDFLTKGEIAATFSWEEEFNLDQIEKITDIKVIPSGIVSKYKHGGFVFQEDPAYFKIGVNLDSLIKTKAVVKSLTPGEKAEKAGILIGDEIISVENNPVTFENLSSLYNGAIKHEEYEFVIKRGENIIKLNIAPSLVPASGLVVAVCDLDKMNWESANKACNELEINGYNDWRLPSVTELQSIFSYFRKKTRKINFGGFSFAEYWSSTNIKYYLGNRLEGSTFYQTLREGESESKVNYEAINNNLLFRAVRSF